ncbi:hypothetical protein NL676_002316 [Syzygium grande]|nr:hypothetical protein NL676_002316 [Syzygium grande]
MYPIFSRVSSVDALATWSYGGGYAPCSLRGSGSPPASNRRRGTLLSRHRRPLGNAALQNLTIVSFSPATDEGGIPSK